MVNLSRYSSNLFKLRKAIQKKKKKKKKEKKKKKKQEKKKMNDIILNICFNFLNYRTH